MLLPQFFHRFPEKHLYKTLLLQILAAFKTDMDTTLQVSVCVGIEYICDFLYDFRMDEFYIFAIQYWFFNQFRLLSGII